MIIRQLKLKCVWVLFKESGYEKSSVHLIFPFRFIPSVCDLHCRRLCSCGFERWPVICWGERKMFPSSSGVEEIHEGRRGVIELNGGVGMKREVQKKSGIGLVTFCLIWFSLEVYTPVEKRNEEVCFYNLRRSTNSPLLFAVGFCLAIT